MDKKNNNIVGYNVDCYTFTKRSASASPKLLNLNQDHPSKKSGFSSQTVIKLRL